MYFARHPKIQDRLDKLLQNARDAERELLEAREEAISSLGWKRETGPFCVVAPRQLWQKRIKKKTFIVPLLVAMEIEEIHMN